MYVNREGRKRTRHPDSLIGKIKDLQIWSQAHRVNQQGGLDRPSKNYFLQKHSPPFCCFSSCVPTILPDALSLDGNPNLLWGFRRVPHSRRKYMSRAEKYHFFFTKLKLHTMCHQTTLRTSVCFFKHSVSIVSTLSTVLS